MTEELVGRIALLEQNCDKHEAAIAGLIEEIRSLRDGSRDTGFSENEKRMPITVAREGTAFWYRPDEKDLEVHHPIESPRLTGVFQSMELKEGEYEGSPTRTAILCIKAAHGVERIRMNATLAPDKSVPFKFFLQSLMEVPDNRLSGDLIFQVSEGSKKQTVKVDILDPSTGQRFGVMKEMTSEEKARASEEGKKRWKDESYWKEALESTMQRINRTAPTETARAATPKPVVTEPIAQRPRPELQDVEMSERRSEAAAARASAKVSRDDAIAFAKRRFGKEASIEMTLSELDDFIHWLNIVEIVHGEMDRIGFTPDQEPEMVSHAGQLSKKRLESHSISALDVPDLERLLEWLGQMPDGSAQMEIGA